MTIAMDDVYRDKVTGVYNKTFFFESGNNILQLAIRNKVPLSLCVIDIDNLDMINEQYSYGIGNQILEFDTQVIRNNIRKSDLLGYMGDGKIGLLLYNVSGINTQAVLDGLRQKVARSAYVVNEQEIYTTVSMGASIINNYIHTKTLDSIYEQAFWAVNMAKEKGKNRVVVY